MYFASISYANGEMLDQGSTGYIRLCQVFEYYLWAKGLEFHGIWEQ